MTGQLATLRMEGLSANRNAVADSVENERTGTARAKAWQREASAEIPSGVPRTSFRSPGAGEKIRELKWDPFDGIAPEIDPVENLSDRDAEPEISWTDFFNNGRPYAENVREYNEHLASKGERTA
jgi:hypothetical protein